MGGGKCPKCIIPQMYCKGPRGAAFSPSIRLGFQMFLGNGLSTCVIHLLLLLTALGGGIQRNRHCVIAHIAQITDRYIMPVAYTWATTQIQRNWCLLWNLGQTRCSFDGDSHYNCFDVKTTHHYEDQWRCHGPTYWLRACICFQLATVAHWNRHEDKTRLESVWGSGVWCSTLIQANDRFKVSLGLSGTNRALLWCTPPPCMSTDFNARRPPLPFFFFEECLCNLSHTAAHAHTSTHCNSIALKDLLYIRVFTETSGLIPNKSKNENLLKERLSDSELGVNKLCKQTRWAQTRCAFHWSAWLSHCTDLKPTRPTMQQTAYRFR